MAYEPRGRVQGLLDMMRAEPERTWNTAEAGEVLQVLVTQVPSYLDAAVRHGAIYRGMVHGRLLYGMKPFPVGGPAADTRAPQVDPGWSPPKMIAPRPGSEQVARPAPAPTRAPVSTPAPTPAPAPAPAAEPDVEEEAVEEEAVEEEGEPDAFISCRTGEIVLVGLEPDEDGRVTIPAELVQMIRRHTAWGPL